MVSTRFASPSIVKAMITCRIYMRAVNYTVIDEVQKIPLRVSDIYRRLIT